MLTCRSVEILDGAAMIMFLKMLLHPPFWRRKVVLNWRLQDGIVAWTICYKLFALDWRHGSSSSLLSLMLTVSPVRRKRSWNTDQVLDILVEYDWQNRGVGETNSIFLAARPDLIVGHNHLPILGEVDVKLKHLSSPDWLDTNHFNQLLTMPNVREASWWRNLSTAFLKAPKVFS